MATHHILRRLLWKEWRLGWPMLAAGLVLPPLATAIVKVHKSNFRSLDWTTVSLFLLLFAIAVWASTLAGRERIRQSYAGAHFPLHPAWNTLNTYLAQGIIVLLIGLNVGWWSTKLDESYPLLNALLLAGLFVGSQFTLSFVVSLAISTTAGIVAGICWILGNNEVLALLTMNNYRISDDPLPLKSIALLSLCIASALLVITIVLLPARTVSIYRRIIACMILGLGTLSLPVYDQYIETWLQKPQWATHILPPVRIHSVDGSLAVEVIRPDRKNNDVATGLRFIDYRQKRIAEHALQPVMQPIGFISHQAVIVAQQRPDDREITLLRWDTITNAMRSLLTIPTRRGALAEVLMQNISWSESSFIAELSPDSHYCLLALPSHYGDAYNLWLVDLQKTLSILVLPHAELFTPRMHVSWLKDDLIISSLNQPLKISLITGKVSRLPIPAPKEDGR
ncbi:MAG: hypothetical protein ACYC7E_06425 [Armatimonadota bacterium]